MSNPVRTAIAFITSVVILTLLGLTFMPASSGYSYRTLDHGRVLYDQMPDFGQRVHVMLHRYSEPGTSERVPMEENGQRLNAKVVVSAISMSRHVALIFSAVLFALVGLFVLWWGRDRPSLWLGLFCATFASPLLNPYGILPPSAMLLVATITSLLAVLSFYALYGLAEAVACKALKSEPARRAIGYTRIVVIALLLVALGADLGGTLLPVLFGLNLPDWFDNFQNIAFSVTIVAGFIIAPLGVLLTGAFLSTETTARRNARIILATTALGLTGVIASAYQSLSHGNAPGFQTPWFTLVLIPIGFAVTIPWLKVVDVRVVLNRALVLAFMTAFVAGLIALSETLLRQLMSDRLLHSWQAEVVTAFVIVLVFNTLDRFFGEWVRRLIYRRETQRVDSLRRFAHGTTFYKLPTTLLADAISELCDTLGASKAAVYYEEGGNYSLLRGSHAGDFDEPVGYDDRAFVALRAKTKRVDLALVAPQPSALGRDGHAFPMAVSGQVTGALVIGVREDEAEGAYVREELEALDEVAQKVGDAIFRMRTKEIVGFVRAVATGSLGDGEVVARARELQDQGLLGVDR